MNTPLSEAGQLRCLKIELGNPSEPIDGPWRWYSCEYSLDGGTTWRDGEIQSDGHLWADETLTDSEGWSVFGKP